MTNESVKAWYKTWWGIALIIVIGFILLNLDNKPSNTNNVTIKTVEKSSPAMVVFNIEDLYGKNIKEIRALLGPPIDSQINPTAQQIKLGAKEWSNTFKKDKYELLVTYYVSSLKIVDYFISTDDPSGLTKDTQKLEEILNVKNSSKFRIELVKSIKDPLSYTGIKVIPKI